MAGRVVRGAEGVDRASGTVSAPGGLPEDEKVVKLNMCTAGCFCV